MTDEHSEAKAVEAGLPEPFTNGSALGRSMSVTLSPEQFEQLYLQPQRSGQQALAAKKVGNPTPIGIIMFIFALLPTSACLMSWRQTTPNSLLGLVSVYYFAGLGMWIAAVGEHFLGNSFPALVMGSFGTFWLTVGGLLDPKFFIIEELGEHWVVPFAFYLLTFAAFVFILVIGSLRTNGVFVFILLTVFFTLVFLGTGYLQLQNPATVNNAARLVKAAGAFGLTASLGGLYLMIFLILSTVDFPYNVPVFDLSHLWSR